MISDRKLKVLCLHGHPGNSEAMQIFAQYFHDRGIGAIAPDLRGYGNCKATVSFTMLDHIQDLWNLLDSDRESEYLILGWSLGGILAIELALRAFELQNLAPKRSIPKIVGLILIATAAKPRSSLPKVAWWEYANLAIAVALHWVVPKQRGPIEWFGKRSLIKYLIQQHTQVAYDQISYTGAKAYLQTSRYAQAALMQALRQGYDRTGDLAKIQIPCFVIAAEQDRHITAASTLETAKLLPNCEFVSYPNTAHLLPWEIGDRLLADIDAWCDRHL
jgi:pimeloyl-ACP methyl ester carboxylesterase